jgi:hypothetical protein
MNKIGKHKSMKKPGASYLYDCAQSEHNHRSNAKHEDVNKQRDRIVFPHFDCRGALKLVVEDDSDIIQVRYRHEVDHEEYVCIDIPEEVRSIVKNGLEKTPAKARTYF